jgi:Polyketide cyclase / dehydrase and lipid transport
MAKKAMADNAKATGNGAPTDALRGAAQELLGVALQRAASAATDRIGDFSDRLTNVTENGGGLSSLIPQRNRDDDGDGGGEGGNGGGPGSAIGSALGGLKEKVQGVFGGKKGGQGGQKKIKLTNMVETLDIGLPLRTTYDLWTQFTDFPKFMKKVESVQQPSDEKTQWKAQVFWSHREWEATIQEQVPDSHIVWRSKGAKGHVDGAVTFTELGPNLTRVALVMEYFPQGLFERTGNLWRAQGRRARLEFKHFRRHAMTQVMLHQEEIEGWRGEIRDSEVVKTHEEALEEEGGDQQEQDYSDMDEVDAAEAEALEADGWQIEPADEDEDLDEDLDDEGVAVDEPEDEADEDQDYDEPEDEAYDDEALDDEDLRDDADGDEAFEDEDLDDEEPYEDEDLEDEERPARRRGRQPVGAGRGRRSSRS